MRAILEDIYCGNYQPEFISSTKHDASRKEEVALWDQVRDTMGLDFVDKLYTGQSSLNLGHEINAFRQGFHLGAMLMLDLLYDAPQRV